MKTRNATAPIYDIQRQAIQWLAARRRFININGIEQQAGISKYSIGRALNKYETAGSFERLECLPFGAVAFVKLLPVLLYMGMVLYKEQQPLPIIANDGYELCGVSGEKITFPQLIELYQNY